MKHPTYILLLVLIIPVALIAQESPSTTEKSAFYSIQDLEKELSSSGRPWLPFIQGENVLAGLYYLKAGSEDRQQPHDTDEIYYVLSGQAKFEAGEENRSIEAGDILFVKAEVDHQFYDIQEDLKLLVFFDQ